MNGKSLKVFLPYLILLIAATYSFSQYAAVNFSGFNSDHAIHVLMAESLELPRDLYFRGQDRVGSLIPILAYPLVQVGVKAIWAVSVVQFGLLTGSVLFLLPFFKSVWKKILIPVIVFLPNFMLLAQVEIGQPYVAQLFLTSCFLWWYFKSGTKGPTKYFVLPLLGALTAWASELALLGLFTFTLLYHKELYQELKNRKNIIAASVSSIIGLLFLFVAKKAALFTQQFYDFFATPDQMMQSFEWLVSEIKVQALFAGNKPPSGILFWLVALILIWRAPRIERSNKLSFFFFITASLTVIAVISSKWSALNGFPLRYYTMPFLFLMLGLIKGLKNNGINNVLLYFMVLLNTYTSIYAFKTLHIEVNDRLVRNEMLYFGQLGDVGIFGSYWNTHSVDALSNDVVASTFHGSYHRMPEKIPQILEKDSIVVIRNGFLPNLPDTFKGHGVVLVKVSEDKKMNEFDYAYYQRLP